MISQLIFLMDFENFYFANITLTVMDFLGNRPAKLLNNTDSFTVSNGHFYLPVESD